MNTLEMLEAHARGVSSSGEFEKMSPEVLSSVMLANNRLLAATIIENGGKLVVSPASIHEMLTTSSHVMALAGQDGSLILTVAPKDEILAKPEVMAL